MKNKLILSVILSLGFIILKAQTTPVKKVLLEEFTTTMCGMCPPQSYNIFSWHEAHEANSILVVLHSGFGTDSMTTAATQTYCSTFQPAAYGFAPAIMIDRAVHPGRDSLPYMSVTGFDTIALRVSQEIPVVGVNIAGTLDGGTRQLNASVTANFTDIVTTADWRIMLMLVEDSVIGSGTGYNQKCYDASFANTHYPGQYNSGTGYIEQYPHRHVLRETLMGTWGASGIIPNTPSTGQDYSNSINYTIPSKYDLNKLSLVAYVEKYSSSKNDRAVLNANEVKLTPTFSTSIEGENKQISTLKLYPCPSSDEVNLEYSTLGNGNVSIDIMNPMGQKIAHLFSGTEAAGSHSKRIDISNIPVGMYVISVSSNGENKAQKLIILR